MSFLGTRRTLFTCTSNKNDPLQIKENLSPMGGKLEEVEEDVGMS